MPKDLKEAGKDKSECNNKELYGIDNFTDMIGDETSRRSETLLEF